MKIYTKTGDNGTTGLFAGPRVAKDHPRISAYGSVDELNAVLGVVLATMETSEEAPNDGNLITLLEGFQSDLFSIGAELATPDPVAKGMCLLTEERVDALERAIDSSETGLPSLENFILPGGSKTAAMLHLARTVCRRAERDIVALSHDPQVHDCGRIIIYLNRLSDLLFVLARRCNFERQIADLPWTRPQTTAAAPAEAD